jgi:hypothetical protein
MSLPFLSGKLLGPVGLGVFWGWFPYSLCTSKETSFVKCNNFKEKNFLLETCPILSHIPGFFHSFFVRVQGQLKIKDSPKQCCSGKMAD